MVANSKNWSRGLPAALDATVISTLQTSTLSGAAKDQGYALRVGEGRKIAAHQEACQGGGGGGGGGGGDVICPPCGGVAGRLE